MDSPLSLLSALFPRPFIRAFTTCALPSSPPSPTGLTQVLLSDKPLGVHKISSGTSHPVVCPPPAPHILSATCENKQSDYSEPPREAWEAFFARGSINPKSPKPGGFGFYLSGPEGFLHRPDEPTSVTGRSSVRETTWAYRVRFETDFQWAKGGKLPGIFGGKGDLAYGCTGGRTSARCDCFDVRVMWRPQGTGELYAYLPPHRANACAVLRVPGSTANKDYGWSIGRGAFRFSETTDMEKWWAVAIRVRMNELGKEDGELELFIDGRSVILLTEIVLHMEHPTPTADDTNQRTLPTTVLAETVVEDVRVKGMHFQTFFGGHTPDWASPRDQHAWFADVSGAVVA